LLQKEIFFSMKDTIKKLRETLPPFLTVRQYCAVKNCCEATAYNHLRDRPGLGVKDGYSTKIVRDVMLDQMAHMPPWVPAKDRALKAKVATRKGSARPRRDKQTAAPRREHDPEVRP
jgi:hypothetical protein